MFLKSYRKNVVKYEVLKLVVIEDGMSSRLRIESTYEKF